MRGTLAVRLALALTCALPIASPSLAEEPLFLRIRPNDDAAVAARARALREEVWARSDRRARIAIASVCTGCLRPLAPAPAVASESTAPDVDAVGPTADTPPFQTAGDP